MRVKINKCVEEKCLPKLAEYDFNIHCFDEYLFLHLGLRVDDRTMVIKNAIELSDKNHVAYHLLFLNHKMGGKSVFDQIKYMLKRNSDNILLNCGCFK